MQLEPAKRIARIAQDGNRPPVHFMERSRNHAGIGGRGICYGIANAPFIV